MKAKRQAFRGMVCDYLSKFYRDGLWCLTMRVEIWKIREKQRNLFQFVCEGDHKEPSLRLRKMFLFCFCARCARAFLTFVEVQLEVSVMRTRVQTFWSLFFFFQEE